MYRGIALQLPRGGSRWLTVLLEPVDCTAYQWLVGPGEEYMYVGRELVDLFPEQVDVLSGGTFQSILEAGDDQFIIFADLKAFPNGKAPVPLATYEAFEASEGELVVLIVDCTYVTIYCKDQALLRRLHDHALEHGVEKLEYLTADNDFRTGLRVW